MLVNPAQYTGFNFDRQNFRFNRENSCYMNYNLKLQSCYEGMPVWVTAVLFILLLKTGWFIQILKKQTLKSERSENKSFLKLWFFWGIIAPWPGPGWLNQAAVAGAVAKTLILSLLGHRQASLSHELSVSCVGRLLFTYFVLFLSRNALN